MFEAHVLHLLRRYLGEYVHGLSAEALRISVWKGDVVLKDLRLKAEALNSLKLPVTVKAGFVGTITLKVPWKSLGKEPVIVLIDRVFILAHPASDGRTLKEEDKKKLFEAKLQQIEEAESAAIEALSGSRSGSPPGGNSWLGALIATIIGNLKISLSNVHIRYEDSISNQGHPFSSGVTLAKLAAVTMDEQGNETFDTSGALDKLRKSLQLERLAIYHDTNSLPWEMDKNWEDIRPAEWIEIFEDGINKPASDSHAVSKWALSRKYVVSPINGVLQYHRLGNHERKDPAIPYEKASLVISDVSLTITEGQYHDWIKLFEVVSRYKTYVEVSHLRPLVQVSQNPHLWWQYAAQAGLQQKKMCYRFSWDQIRKLCQLRRRYVQLYACLLQNLSNADNTDIRSIERDLDSKVILLWRLLAHAKVESVRSKEAAKRRSHRKRSWFSFRWGATSENPSADDSSEESPFTEERLSKEEWQRINNFLSYQLDEGLTLYSGKDMQNMIHFLVNVSIGQAAARIVSINQTEMVCGRFEELHVSTKFKHRSTLCDVSLRSYGLSAPEGSLAQSFSSEQKVNALAASFVQNPVGENIDWRLSATISPCHVTVLMESYDRFIEFLRRSNAVSPIIALETATALQMKIEKVTRRAQEQLQMVLEDKSRFALDIDFDAPKVRVPIGTRASSSCDSHFLLDFGHFTLQTKDSQPDENRQSLYSRFYIYGRDIAAFFSDSGADCQNCTLVSPSNSQLIDTSDCYSLVDRCGMAVIIDQIKVPHPSYPSTRVSFQVPNIGIHFSPARYLRLTELLNILYRTIDPSGQSTVGNFKSKHAWDPADIAMEARILVWKGIGNSVAVWQSCFLVLSGIYLYVLESQTSQTYQRCSSMAGRHVYEVSPTNIGGSLFCLAVSFRGLEIQKVLESSSTLILKFQDEEEKTTWMKRLTQATYQASTPPSFNVLEESSDGVAECADPPASSLKTADLVVNGALVETKLFIYGKFQNRDEEYDKVEETLILEVLAGGGKVHVVLCDGELSVKTKLRSLKIKDELQGRWSNNPKYLACSVVKNDHAFASPSTSDCHRKDLPVFFAVSEEDENFTDALSDFTSLPDTQNMDIAFSFVDSADTFLQEKDLGKGKCTSVEMFYETQESDNSDFVSVTFSMRSPDSPNYGGIDTQMSIRMSRLEFFCNRPTLVALIDFGLELSSWSSAVSNLQIAEDLDGEALLSREKAEGNENAFVKGLLGHGKGRAVFHLNLNVDSVSVFLNKEDDSQFAMFVQESFQLDLKVHPSSLSIEGTLGNFRLCDMSLGIDHHWSWLCDIRNQGVESLIKFTFKSYNAEDDDYDGYDYSLCGRLSAVRIVFLYRFVQEITTYFMELAPPHTEDAIKLVDKVGGIEWLIQKYEIDGAPAIKLDLSLDTPLIIIPKNSISKDFMQLDLGQLQVNNKFSWHGSPETDPSAVHIDVLHAKIFGINMAVSVNGEVGSPMIREGQEIDLFVRRTLRDVFRKVPTFSAEMKVGSLHGVMSNKEYNVILDCAYMNLSEEARLPPSFRGDKSGSNDTMRLLADKVNLNSQIFLSWTVTIVAVEVNYALLELCNCVPEESPLARIALEGFWVSYRMTSLSETDLYITIPKFSIFDIRPGTKPEMRLMLGSSSDVTKQSSAGDSAVSNKSGYMREYFEASPDINIPSSTMFLMDYRLRASSQSFVIRVQQPRILVVPDFLLSVCEFFVPALSAITGREEAMDPKNDPIIRNNSIILSDTVYNQIEDVVHLSSNRQLIADALGTNDYIYDGCGKTICLTEEADSKEIPSSRFRPIIIIGRGKRLRFVNVKIENGFLLRRYTYMSYNSSYSVSLEDGVDILFPDNFCSDDDRKHLGYMNEASDASYPSDSVQSDLSKMQSFTFEAQVVSPELTFYDSTKSCLDDSSQGEKLLRAKLDLSFMYAYKESDTWIRTLVKDLTLESGTGLTILDAVDISGGYTSVKDKTNVSIISTDICIHLSLSIITLVLNLQSQAASALQFRNANPLALCTNFECLRVSSEEIGMHNSLTFWRPRAPSNYVILGDCVTSRPIPPSQAVMAVNNVYGRVRKPLGFELIGVFTIQGLKGSEDHSSDISSGCSVWLPVAPPGYVALGCVAQIGSQPPPMHTVYCIRSDLVTSTTYTECIYTVVSNPLFSSGFSIWRIDNVLGNFFAHNSQECPSSSSSCDLNHLLLWNSDMHYSSRGSGTGMSMAHGYGGQSSNNHSASSSRWDIIRSISKVNNCCMSTPHFERIWYEKGSDARQPVSIWRPIPRPNYAILGDCITEGLEPPALGIIFKDDDPEISAKPVQFTKVAHIAGKGLDEAFFWYPIAPPGYAALGCMVTKTDEAPNVDSLCCPRMDLVHQANILEIPISRSLSSKASHCWSIWKVENQACTFLARADLIKPSSRLAYSIGDSLKPKTRDNITAEVRLSCLSLTVLDSLCGTITPLFDTTITNVKLATHGRLEAMNAVLISSIAASTFNTQLEAWEPLVEPFDGIFQVETYDGNVNPPSRPVKKLRIAATSILNINISAANLETFAETIVSWRRHIELEKKANKLNEEARDHQRDGNNLTFSALDEDDFQTVIVENKLGCDIYLKKIEHNSERVELLHHDTSTSAWIPPPRFSDRLNVANESREASHYVAVQIIEAKGLPIFDDGNSHTLFCALRLVVGSQATDQQKLFPQSARTKCVKPFISKSKDLLQATAKWNELFIFEIPRKMLAKLEVEVTNLAAKSGKGEVIGSFSISIGHDANKLKKVASVRMLHQQSDVQNIMSYPLKRRGQLSNDEDMSDNCGCLSVSTCLLERKTTAAFREIESGNSSDRDIGFWVGLGSAGAWESVRSLLPLSVVPKTLNDDFIAVDVFMDNGKKHAIFRGLATVINDSDVRLDIMICHESMINDPSLETRQQITGNIPSFTLNPGSSANVPWKCMFRDSDQCLLVRPLINYPQPSYSWGLVFSIDDQPLTAQGSLSRQNTSKQGKQKPVSAIKINHLEKKDVLLQCRPHSGNKAFWLSLSTDASVLHTELNAPVYDWKISVNASLILENRLPCQAEFAIWEKIREGYSVERQHGIVLSRGSVHIYYADIRNPLYLTLFVQGGWILEKDPVLILDLSSNNHASSFWMIHQQSKRRLRISIELDMGGAVGAPKTIRVFVPYWIINDTSLPLSYQVVEIEPLENADNDSLLLSKSFKSSKTAFKTPANSMERRQPGARKNIQVLDVIEETSLTPSMLSPQDYVGRSGVMLFQPRNDACLSPRVGVAVAIRHSEHYSPGISLLELENKEWTDVKAFSSDGSYYKLSAVLNMTSDRTKVVHFQPHTLFVNRVGSSVCLKQCDTQSFGWIHPTEPAKPFVWQSSNKVELLKLRMDGYNWSTPFSVGTEGVMRIPLKHESGSNSTCLRVEVRSGSKSSRYEVIFRPNSLSSPYRIENRSIFLPIRFRQVDGTDDSWQSLLPNAAASFFWEDLGRQQLLEILVDGEDLTKSEKYNIDEIFDHQPNNMVGGPSKPLCVSIVKDEKVNIVKISDWMPESENSAIMSSRLHAPHLLQLSKSHSQHQQPKCVSSDCESHVILELAELGVSIIDHTPEEILYLSVQNCLLSYSTSMASGINRFKLRMRALQVDNQLPLTPMPVLFRPQRVGEDNDYILELSVTLQSSGSLDLCNYPDFGLHGPKNSAFLINIHEPIIWRLHEMIQQVNLYRLYNAHTTAVSVDPIIQIGVLSISEIRFRVSMAMSPTQRPRGVLGFWSSLMTALGNTENMQIRINQRFNKNVSMRQSALINNAITNIQKDLLGQPLQLLSGVDILGNASSALGHMSKGVAALSMDKKFIQSRQKQDNKGVEDLGDVIREGGGALAKGLFRGFTGILTKPLEGAKSSGVEGFVQGVGKGLIGAAAQPVSGVLDLLSKTTEGANAVRMKIASAITSEEQLLRKRLPRVIGGDNLLRPYDDYKAQGQVILQLAESVSFLGQVDLFKVRGKFALSDAYEDHFLLPKGKILVVTHRRVILMQQTAKFTPARDPCAVVWDVLWDDLVTMELTHGKDDHPKAPPSQLILYLQMRSADSNDPIRVVNCNRDSDQALKIYSSIEQAMSTYGRNQKKELIKRKVTRPYSAIVDGSSSEAIPKEGVCIWSPQYVPTSVPLSSTFGSNTS